MKIILHAQKYSIICLVSFLILFLSCSPAFSRMITQIIPTLTITEEYSDNYFQTQDNEQDEYITSYGLGFSVGFLNKKSKIYLAYNPEYKDYKNLDDRDGFEHIVSLDGEFFPSKFTTINAHLGYTSESNDDNEEEYQGDTWENTASLSVTHQLAKNTDLNFSQSYTQTFDQQERTGSYREHEVNKTLGGISHQFGKNDIMGFDFSYEFDDYKDPDADEYTEYSPSGFITYWFTPLNGIESNLSYEKRESENFNNDRDTYTGDIRYLRKFSKHFNGYVKYRHSFSDRESGDHTIYNPSAGFDWNMTKDSGISMGLGILHSEWDNDNDDSTDPFLEMDAYKTFNFSKRGSLSITGASGYNEGSEDADSLGYNIYYRAGFRLNYQLLKRVSSNVFGSYEQNDYREEADRKDNTLNLGGGLSWSPLKWLRFNLSYSYEQFDTDATERDDYEENKVTISVSLIPE